MKFFRTFTVLAGLLHSLLPASAATYYVAQNNPNPTAPYASWNTAATNIQDAINAAADGDQILVTNGIYSASGLAMVGTMTNRVCLNKPLTVQSVNGPWVTFIQGAGVTNGPAAVRCAWLTNGASLVGFTLQGGATETSGTASLTENGGGVWCASASAIVANCVIVSNTCYNSGSGAYQGHLQNCFVSRNSCVQGDGGAISAELSSCTIASNIVYGVDGCLCTNCIIYYNTYGDRSGGTFVYCCTSLLPAGVGNITNAPQFLSDGIHLGPGSRCIGAGTNVVSGTDIFGQSWFNPPSIGCAEVTSAPQMTTPQIQLTSNPVGFTVGNSAISGQPPFYCWWLQNGLQLQDNGHFSFTQSSNLIATGVGFSDAANYQLVVSNSFGTITSSVVPLVIHCVAAAGANPLPPYSTWSTAATNIQDAITSASAGDVVLVTNGIYSHGGISMDGVITNCVSINRAILVQGVNGPSQTTIQGAWDPVTTNGLGAVRGAWLTNSAILGGFTIQGGATRAGNTSAYTEGGGIYGVSTNATVCNCVLSSNVASYYGGGAFAVTLNYCTLTENRALTAGGGADRCFLRGCMISSNVCNAGSGTAACNAFSCLYTQNSGAAGGGGGSETAYQGSLVNCTVTGNTNTGSGPSAVGAAILYNCIVYSNFPNANYSSCTMTWCDSDPLPAGTGNMDANPQLFADGIHLASTSPCIGAGTYSVVSGTDINGNPWKTPPSIGCSEFESAPFIATQPGVQINLPAHSLMFNVGTAGEPPFAYFWSLNGTPLEDNGHFQSSATAGLVVSNFGPNDAGFYQVVVSNAFGSVTSQVAQAVIHVVNAAGANPIAPYSTWATAATNIQDAINVAYTGDIVLVTNGVYTYGGVAVASGFTNRVALTAPLTVVSANGYAVTAIQGAWDPIGTNGPGAVRCAYVGDGATLFGFTLQNGATRSTGDASAGGPLESGGGVWCNSTNGIVSNCVLTNNCAIYGGGIAYGTLNNSLVLYNQSFRWGGGGYSASLNNCTVIRNYADYASPQNGAGTYNGIIRNSIVLYNYDNSIYSGSGTPQAVDNYYFSGIVQYYNTCTAPDYGQPSLIGNGNTNISPQFLDLFHLAATSRCRGAGSATNASGTDLDGQSWANPPAMGCSEVVVSNLVGPLSASVICYQPIVVVGSAPSFQGFYTGNAAANQWSFGDGQIATNINSLTHSYTNSGSYTVTFTVYNNDNPAGVSASTVVQVQPLSLPQLQFPTLLTNGFQFQFLGQNSAMYTIQYATNLVAPVTWNTLQIIYSSTGGINQITDATTPTGTRFYRVLAQ